MEMASSGKREGVKIVQIETRYVETDAMNFRDVVQSLTGKNSSTAWIGSGGGGGGSKVPRRTASVKSEEFQLHDHGGRSHKEDASLSSMMMTSYKDFDRLLYELPPPTEELQWLVGR